MIIVENEYEIGSIVYLKTDEEQSPRIITSITVYSMGDLVYHLGKGTESSQHYEFELSKDKVFVLKNET